MGALPVITGHLNNEQAEAFVSLLADTAPFLRKVRIVRMPGADRACMEVMRSEPRGSRPFVRALASLAGVKLRKARVFLSLDRGYLAATARRRINEALMRAATSGEAE